MKLYLAYGSNLNKAQMAYRCPDAEPIGTSNLHGWHLVFRRGVLTIEPKKGSFVPIGIWKISDMDERSLDRYEGYPRLYYKKNFVFLNNLDHGTDQFGEWSKDEWYDLMAYIMTDGHPIQSPGKGYMETCLQGYRDFGLNPAPLVLAYRESKGGYA